MASSRSYGRAGRFQAGISAGAGQHDSRGATTRGSVAVRGGRSPCRSRRRPTSARPCRTFAGHDLEQAARGALWRMTECWLDSGFVTMIGRPSGSPSPGTRSSATGANRSTIAGETRAWVTASVRPAPARTSRGPCRAAAAGRWRYAGMAVCGRIDGHEVVAANASDLLGDIGLDDEVAAPGRHDRDDGLCVARIHGQRLRLDRDRDRGSRPARVRSRCRPAPGARAAPRSRRPGAEQSVDPGGPEGDPPRRPVRSGPCRRRRSRRSRRPTRR